jgi:hypothetical protein
MKWPRLFIRNGQGNGIRRINRIGAERGVPHAGSYSTRAFCYLSILKIPLSFPTKFFDGFNSNYKNGKGTLRVLLAVFTENIQVFKTLHPDFEQ